jgi:hypothetical protein
MPLIHPFLFRQSLDGLSAATAKRLESFKKNNGGIKPLINRQFAPLKK